MRATTLTSPPHLSSQRTESSDRAESLRAYYEGQRALRKGLCMLNAGVFEAAIKELSSAQRANPLNDRLASCMIRALVGSERYAEAAEMAASHHEAHPEDLAGVIRLALTQWKAGNANNALQTLREAVANHPDNAELHFQLGTLLAAMDQSEEAHLRFVQAVAINNRHADALASLALSYSAQGDWSEALHHMQRAQRSRPDDARIAIWLAHTAQAAKAAGIDANLRVDMPSPDSEHSPEVIEKLSQLVEHEPEFVDACVAMSEADVEPGAFELLAQALQTALERDPQQAELHYLRGKILAKIGRSEEAIASAERAVDIDPHMVKALVLLAEQYHQTNRSADARQRLEEAVLRGAEYADLFYFLGNLYREDGELHRARWAYERALQINQRYAAAQEALATLAA